MQDEITNVPKIIDEALKAIGDAHGRRLQYVQHIGSNRGVDVAKVAEDGAIYSLKVVDHEDVRNHPEFDPDFRVESIRREGRSLERLSAHQMGGYINHGSSERLSWVVTRWIDGQSASELARGLRGNKANDQNFLHLFSSLIRPVAALHRAGFLHADLQPIHFIRSADGAVHLIDFGLAHEIGDHDAPYKGGFVHFNAPEIARQMLRKSDRADYNLKSEIYSLGAVLFFLYTGKVPINYGSDDLKSVPFETKLRMIAQGRLRSFADCGVSPCLPIETFLQKFLAFDPLERFDSLDEALERLEDVTGDFDHLTSEAHHRSTSRHWEEKHAELKERFSSGQITVLLFDLDGTLYPSTAGLEYQIKPRMVETCAEKLSIAPGEASRLLAEYRAKYGASVIGLERHQGLNGLDFLEDVFIGLDLSGIKADPALKECLAILAWHKLLALGTNSSAGHAGRVLDILEFKEYFTHILTVEDAGFIRKPSAVAYETALSKIGVAPSQVMVFDDSYLNIIAAKSLGMATVLVSNGIATPPQFWEMHRRVFHEAPEEADARTHDLPGFLKYLAV